MAVKVSGVTVIDNSRNADVNTLSIDGTQVTATATELNYVDGVTSAIQTQLDNKLIASNNLSDLADAATARTNLGVAIGTDVQAYDSNLTSYVSTFTLPTTDGTSGQVLQTNGSGILSFATPAGGFEKVRVYQYLSSGSFVPPNNGNYLVIVIGAGGGGACSPTSQAATGGGAGGVSIKSLSLSTAVTYTVTVGSGGAGRSGNNLTGNNGGNSSFAGSGISTITGNGGSGGNVGATSASAAAGGTASGGDFNFTGGASGAVTGINSGYAAASGGGAISNLFQNGFDAPDVASSIGPQPAGAGVMSSGSTTGGGDAGSSMGIYAITFPLPFNGEAGVNGSYGTPSIGTDGGPGGGGGGGGGASSACAGGNGGFGGGGGGTMSVNSGGVTAGAGGIGGGGGGAGGNASVNSGAGGNGAVFIIEFA